MDNIKPNKTNLNKLNLDNNEAIPLSELDFRAVRSQGAGGQNVNKVATAIHLRFDILKSSLSEKLKQKLINLNDSRVSKDGVIIIKSQQYRTQEKNRMEAVKRLESLVNSVAKVEKKRIATRPSKTAKQKRLNEKSNRSEQKNLRRKISM